MSFLTLNSPAKINLGLFIKGKRPDGYHDLETLFVPVPQCHDVLHIEKLSGNYPPVFTYSGTPISGPTDNNLVRRAYDLLRTHYPKVGPVRMALEKNIPMGAGLGGGSSNAATVLRGLNELFRLGLNTEALSTLAIQLGSDVPFFLHDAPMYATGRGEQLSPLSIPHPRQLQIVNPGIHVNTAQAYGMLNMADCHTDTDLRPLLALPPSQWKHSVVNDFEAAVFHQHPQLAQIKQQLYAEGATYASLSGSGSALYGLFY